MHRLPPHPPPSNKLPFTPPVNWPFYSHVVGKDNQVKTSSSDERTVLVDAGHFGREYNSKQGVESFQYYSPFHPWDFFLRPQYSSQNPEHVFLSHAVIFLNHVIKKK